MANFWISPRVSIGCLEHVWWRCLLYCTCQATCIFPIFVKRPTLVIVCWKRDKTLTFDSFCEGAEPIAPATRKDASTCKFAVVLPFWLRSPSRSSWVHFLDGSLYKMPPMFFFFHFETRFAPQPRTLFQQFNVQNRSGPEALLAFWLENLLRATAAWLFRNTISKIARSMTRFNYFDFETHFFTTVAGTYWFLFWPDGAAAALARAHFSILRSPKTLQTSFSHTLIVFLLASSFLPLPSAAAASVHKLQVWLPNFFL